MVLRVRYATLNWCGGCTAVRFQDALTLDPEAEAPLQALLSRYAGYLPPRHEALQERCCSQFVVAREEMRHMPAAFWAEARSPHLMLRSATE